MRIESSLLALRNGIKSHSRIISRFIRSNSPSRRYTQASKKASKQAMRCVISHSFLIISHRFSVHWIIVCLYIYARNKHAKENIQPNNCLCDCVCFVRRQDAMVDDLIELVIQHTGFQVRNTSFKAHCTSKPNIVTRQARDKHEESSKREAFSCSAIAWRSRLRRRIFTASFASLISTIPAQSTTTSSVWA